ncbi:hypothetical protein GCM10010503_09770 [Streptomyces lucensis JCM 4490]|uniref:Uncharacterized protein n=1 Tax=Streptomyces lucensis JCM 4490 TaxID=1306176 RepID=A0A918IXY5_9ACTN|nr:hypothetical protein GCM10010503_09770 [Streptomyces lucensis JCM 4490]
MLLSNQGGQGGAPAPRWRVPLAHWGLAKPTEAALLCVSDLVANVLDYAGPGTPLAGGKLTSRRTRKTPTVSGWPEEPGLSAAPGRLA